MGIRNSEIWLFDDVSKIIFRISNFFVTSISGEQEFESDDADTIDRTSTSEDDDSEALIAAVTDAIR